MDLFLNYAKIKLFTVLMQTVFKRLSHNITVA